MLTPAFSSHLVRRYGSPLYVYDLLEVERRHEELRSALPRDSTLLFSMKANPLPALCSVLKDAGCAVELSSSGELSVAKQVGFDLKRALYTGPGKTDQELQFALESDVGYFSCESARDVRRLTARDTRAVALLLRVNPADGMASGLSMSGRGTQFGFPEETLTRDLFPFPDRRELLVGMHVYHGTQLSTSGALETSFQTALQTALRVADRLSLSPRIFDLGGGFPWPFATLGPSTDLCPLISCLAKLQGRLPEQTDLWFESGRFLVASSGVLLSVVQDVRRQESRIPQIILDAGIHHLGGMSGLQRIARPTISLLIARAPRSGGAVADVFGPLCTPLDCLARQLELPELPDAGDCVQIPNVGAYGLTASLTGFLSRPPPVEVVVRGEQVQSVFRLRTGHELSS